MVLVPVPNPISNPRLKLDTFRDSKIEFNLLFVIRLLLFNR